MSNLINKAKDLLSKDKTDDTTTYENESSYGSTNPNVGGGYGTHGHPGSTNAGPHSSNLTNKADPRYVF